jgi:hypothetical protein
MSFTGQQILDRARLKANDTTSGSYTWGDTEALLWINDAQRAIVGALPKAGATSAMPTVAAGSRQTLAGLSLTDGIEIIDVVCNVSGTTRGAPVRRTSRAWLDDNVPGWHVATGAAIEHWTFDERDPKAFYIYPQVASGTPKLEIIYAKLPADLASLGSTFGLDDIYADAAQNFVLFSFFSKDITKLKSAQLAQTYWNLFRTALGLREQNILQTSAAGKAKESGEP